MSNNLRTYAQRSLKAQVDTEADIREDTLLGRDYMVVPVIAMVEGVRLGGNQDGPELGLASEFGDVPIVWSYRPLVLNHPQIDGDFVSANSPEVLEQYQFGWTMNPIIEDGKLKMEAWIDIERVSDLDGEFVEIVDLIKAGETVEVSVGFFSALEKKKGKFKGQAYTGIWRNIRPDHLAILSVGTIGACSIEEGCGIPRINEAKMAKSSAVPKIKADSHTHNNCGCGGESTCSCSEAHVHEYVEAEEIQVENLSAITANLGKIVAHKGDDEGKEVEPTEEHKQEFASKIAANNAVITQAIDGQMLDRDVRTVISKALRQKFGKDIYLQAFSSEYAYFEQYCYCYDYGYEYKTHRVGINITDDVVEFVGDAEEVILLTKVVPVTQSSSTTSEEQDSVTTQKENDMADEGKKPKVETEGEDPKTKTEVKSEAGETSSEPVAQAAKKLTVNEYIEQAPDEVKEVLQSSMRMHQDKKNKCIEKLKAHKRNRYTEEALKAMSLENLEMLVDLAGETVDPDYSGMARPANPTTQSSENDNIAPAPLVFERKTSTSESQAS